MRRRRVGERVVEAQSQTFFHQRLAIQRDWSAEHERKQTQIVQAKYVVGMFVWVNNTE